MKKEEYLKTVGSLCYYCKECNKIVKPLPSENFKFVCPVCHKTNISFGTEKSIKNHYNIKE